MINILWIDEGEEYFEPVPQQFGPPTQSTALMQRLMAHTLKQSLASLRLFDKSPVEGFGKIGTSLRIRLPTDFKVAP